MNSCEELESAGIILEHVRFVPERTTILCIEKYPDENKDERSRAIQEALQAYNYFKCLNRNVQWIRNNEDYIKCLALDYEDIPSEIFFQLNES